MSEAQQLLRHYAAIFQLDEFTLRIASDLLKSALQSDILKKKTDLLVRCAILVASRQVASRESFSQIDETKRGEKKKVALTQILSEGFNICEFSAGLQKFLVILEIETHTIREMMNIVQNCEFVQTLYDKYQILLNKTNLQEYRTIGWLLFSIARRNILSSQNDPLQSIEVMLNIVALVMRSTEQEASSLQTLVSSLKEMLDLPVNNKGQNYQALFKQFFGSQGLLEAEGDLRLNLSKQSQEQLLSALNQKLNTLRSADELDDRFFLNTPDQALKISKNLNFVNRCIVTPAPPSKPLNFAIPIPRKACVQLNYSCNSQNTPVQTNSPSQSQGIKVYPKDAVQSPFSLKPRAHSSTPLPTPMTASIIMNSWLLESMKRYSVEEALPTTLKKFYGERIHQAEDKIESIVNFLGQVICVGKRGHISAVSNETYFKSTTINRTQQLRGIFLYFIESMLENQDHPNFYPFLGACAAQTILFIKNVQSAGFLKILSQSKLHPYHFYSLLDPFLTKHQNLPSSLKHHFSVIREKILLEWAWMDDSPLRDQLVPKDQLSDFYQDVLESAASRVLSLIDALALSQGQGEKVWLIVKFVIKERTSVLFSRHVDQIVLCATYIITGPIAKSQGYSPISFSSILKRYKELKDQNLLQAKLIITEVKIEDRKYSDIVDFYNSIFLPLVKEFIYNSRTISMTAQSPSLKECERIIANRRKNLALFGGELSVGMTPRTLALRAPFDQKLPKPEERQRKILTQLQEEQQEEEEPELKKISSEEHAPRDSSRMFGKSLFSNRKPNT